MSRVLHQTKLLGILFLAALVAAVYLTYAVFTNKFADWDRVTLQSSKIGLQLPERADVKIRGVIVGEVLDTEATTEGAEITLGIEPGQRHIIPANVTGSIVPKTLFGEKYVSLVVPAQPDPEPIEPGGVITRTEVATEVEQVLSDLYPLLRTVRPADLNATLTAVATALEGRGELIGENLETVDSYLKRLNPQIPALVEDLRLTAEVSDTYAAILPQVGQILQDSVTTTGTLEEREQELTALFADTAALSDTAGAFLAENEENLIRLGEVGRQYTEMLARYAPGFPCLTAGLVGAGKRQAEAFRGHELHIVLETVPFQPRPYDAGDVPRFGEQRGYTCLHLPNPPGSQDNPMRRQPNLDDGVDRPTGKGTSRVAPAFGLTGSGPAGTTAEADLLRELLGTSMGMPAEDVDDLGVLLLGPMARGAQVTLR